MVGGDQPVPGAVQGGGGGGGVGEGSQQEAAGVRDSEDRGCCDGSASDGGGEGEKEKSSQRWKERGQDLYAAANN